MNEFGVSLIWLALQVSVLCVVTMLVYWVARRSHPAAGVLAALTGLLLVVVLSAAAFSPWPRWTLRTGTTDSSAPESRSSSVLATDVADARWEGAEPNTAPVDATHDEANQSGWLSANKISAF